jgi:hypothetical protein
MKEPTKSIASDMLHLRDWLLDQLDIVLFSVDMMYV